MKKYTSHATKWLAILTIISIVVLIAGIICIFAYSSNFGLQILLTSLSGLMSILFLSCFFAEKSRYFAIGCEKLFLPRGTDINGKMVSKRTIANIDEITSVESNLYKGDGLISKDAYFYTLKLKDGTKITFTLYAYGKEAEKEIIETIKKSV